MSNKAVTDVLNDRNQKLQEEQANKPPSSAGNIVGIILGIIAGLLVLAGIGWLIVYKTNKLPNRPTHTPVSASGRVWARGVRASMEAAAGGRVWAIDDSPGRLTTRIRFGDGCHAAAFTR